MRRFIWMASSILALTTGCSGFAPRCTTDADCSATSYCNSAAQACFIRDTGASVPIIDTVTVSGTGVTVVGTAPASSTVGVFTNATCVGTPAGTGTAGASGSFSIVAIAPTTGTVYATAEGADFASVCSGGKSYP
jgi:hypothetical protein